MKERLEYRVKYQLRDENTMRTWDSFGTLAAAQREAKRVDDPESSIVKINIVTVRITEDVIALEEIK